MDYEKGDDGFDLIEQIAYEAYRQSLFDSVKHKPFWLILEQGAFPDWNKLSEDKKEHWRAAAYAVAAEYGA